MIANSDARFSVDALVFDAYGTLFDVQSVAMLGERICPGRGDELARLWRTKQLEYTWLQSLVSSPTQRGGTLPASPRQASAVPRERWGRRWSPGFGPAFSARISNFRPSPTPRRRWLHSRRCRGSSSPTARARCSNRWPP